MAHCEQDGVFKLVTQARWDKTKARIAELDSMLAEVEDENSDVKDLDRKTLESIRGFLNYVGLTYKAINTFLKGMHLTIDGWRPHRDSQGWKLLGWKHSHKPEAFCDDPAAPERVVPAPRLRNDIEVLKYITQAPT